MASIQQSLGATLSLEFPPAKQWRLKKQLKTQSRKLCRPLWSQAQDQSFFFLIWFLLPIFKSMFVYNCISFSRNQYFLSLGNAFTNCVSLKSRMAFKRPRATVLSWTWDHCTGKGFSQPQWPKVEGSSLTHSKLKHPWTGWHFGSLKGPSQPNNH